MSHMRSESGVSRLSALPSVKPLCSLQKHQSSQGEVECVRLCVLCQGADVVVVVVVGGAVSALLALCGSASS